MTEQPIGPRCGNNPNFQMSDGDRKAVEDFKARLALQAAIKPYIDAAVWVDGDPLMEVIAATVWKHCARDDEDMPQLVCDDPRTIAAFAAAVARAHADVMLPPAGRAAVLLEAVSPAERLPIADLYRHHSQLCDAWDDGRDAVVRLLRRLAAEAQCPGIETVPNRCTCDCEGCKHHCGAHNPAEAQQPDTETRPGPCAHCGKLIRRITGTLAAWWVHDPGGHTICFPEQAASSPRATPAVPVQPAAADTSEEARAIETVHGCPPDGSGLTPCCGRTPFELPISDRISSEAPVTCKGPRS